MIVYVDVDDTLVRSAGGTRIPMPGVIEHVKQLKADGATLYLWSAGGADYCRATAIELGIEDCFVAFLPKPRIMIDARRSRIGCSARLFTRRLARESDWRTIYGYDDYLADQGEFVSSAYGKLSDADAAKRRRLQTLWKNSITLR